MPFQPHDGSILGVGGPFAGRLMRCAHLSALCWYGLACNCLHGTTTNDPTAVLIEVGHRLLAAMTLRHLEEGITSEFSRQGSLVMHA